VEEAVVLKSKGRLRIDGKTNEELIKLLCLRYAEEPTQPNGHLPFDHALNDDMIRLTELDHALSRLSGMHEIDTHQIATSLLEEIPSDPGSKHGLGCLRGR